MAALRRYLQSAVEHDLNCKMVFVGGPRQVGKTELGKMIIADPAASACDERPYGSAQGRLSISPIVYVLRQSGNGEASPGGSGTSNALSVIDTMQ